VKQVKEDEPWNPSHEHEHQSGGIDPLGIAIAFVHNVVSDAGAVNEAIGSPEEG
jgi:hypothetical protein